MTPVLSYEEACRQHMVLVPRLVPRLSYSRICTATTLVFLRCQVRAWGDKVASGPNLPTTCLLNKVLLEHSIMPTRLPIILVLQVWI